AAVRLGDRRLQGVRHAPGGLGESRAQSRLSPRRTRSRRCQAAAPEPRGYVVRKTARAGPAQPNGCGVMKPEYQPAMRKANSASDSAMRRVNARATRVPRARREARAKAARPRLATMAISEARTRGFTTAGRRS